MSRHRCDWTAGGSKVPDEAGPKEACRNDLQMENAAIMGTPYPQTLADAYQTAACWKVDKAGGSNGGEHATNLDQTSSYLLADETGEQQRMKIPRTGERSAAGKRRTRNRLRETKLCQDVEGEESRRGARKQSPPNWIIRRRNKTLLRAASPIRDVWKRVTFILIAQITH